MQEEFEVERRAWKRAQRESAQDPDLVAWLTIIARDPCAYCGAPFEEAEHIVAQRRGGEDAWTNLTAACFHCNRTKWAHPLLHFLLRAASAH
jgi:5-methylcytosine-specific restriction endonuclease McrA